MQTDALLNAEVAKHHERYPVLLAVPGWAGTLNENTTLVQDLASRGFIVAAIGYEFIDYDRRSARHDDFDLSCAAAFDRTLQNAEAKIMCVAAASVSLLGALTDLDRADPSGRFTGRLDLGCIGVVGYSLGGSIGVQLCSMDARVKAAVNIDGWLFNVASDGWITQPFLFITDDTPLPTSADLRAIDLHRRHTAILNDETERRRRAVFAQYGGTQVTIRGSSHLDFSDMAFKSRILLLTRRRPDGSIVRTAADYAAAFFLSTLRGEPTSLFENPLPGVRVETAVRLTSSAISG